MNKWALADSISDQIVDLLNEATKRQDFDPVQVFLGQLLAILAFAGTAPPFQPAMFTETIETIERCRQSIANKAES